MKICVTEEDIQAGSQDDCVNCPVARAIARATGRNVKVWGDAFQFADSGLSEGPQILLGEDVVDWISRYDTGDFDDRMEPIEFELSILP